MQKYIFTLCSFLLTQLFISCNNEKSGNDSIVLVNIEANLKKMEAINLSRFTDSIWYLVFENKENHHFTAFTRFDISENQIIVTSPNGYILYDYAGHFISKIGNKGRGPGEYQFLSGICIGNQKNIYISDLYDILVFNNDGSFVKKYEKSFLINNIYYITSWITVDDSLFFGHIPNTTGQTEFKALMVNKHGDVKHYYNNYILFNYGRTVASYLENYANIYQFKNLIFYKELYNDTLFYLNVQYELIPKFVFNFGKFKEPVSERAKLKGLDVRRYLYLWDVFQTENFLFLRCQFGDQFPAKRLTPRTLAGGTTSMVNTSQALGLFNKQTKELVFCKPTSTDNTLFTSGLYNDIDAGPRFFPQKQINDSTMVMWVEAKQLKDHVASDDFKNNNPKYPEKKKELERLANNLSEFDNPVLMMVTFKRK